MLERQEHPFSPYIPSGAIALIIGTAPPWNLCDKNSSELREGEIPFFYGSIHNLFWYVIKAVFEPDNPRWPRTRQQCESFLRRNHLGIGDILQSFMRQDRKAADDHLSDFHYNRRMLSKLRKDNHQIRYLYFTSQFASELFLKALKKHKRIYHIHSEDRSHKSFVITLQQGSKTQSFRCFVLSSPSPRINRSLDDMIKDYSQKFALMQETDK